MRFIPSSAWLDTTDSEHKQDTFNSSMSTVYRFVIKPSTEHLRISQGYYGLCLANLANGISLTYCENKKKTKVMCNEVARSRLRTGVMIDGEQLEEVNEYKYLGRLVISGNDISKEIAQRTTSGWRKFGEYNHFFKERSLFARREKIMDTVILPAMTYGAETWTLTKHQEKLAVAQRNMERSLLNITKRYKIRNEVIRSQI